MRICILGIAGTFMSALAQLAKMSGHTVYGIDIGLYPPMSDVLKNANIPVHDGYEAAALKNPDLVIVGNSISRGNPCFEEVLNRRLPYQSGPEWLYDSFLKGREVFAVTGTHGKTTTTAMIVHAMKCAGLNPGFLIAGSPMSQANMTEIGQDYFILEADEYDTACFDKQPKFLRYRPHRVIVNNIEFDHADIYQDIGSIEQQFRRLMQLVPQNGSVCLPKNDLAYDLKSHTHAAVTSFGLHHDADWTAQLEDHSWNKWSAYHLGEKVFTVEWTWSGEHMVHNALAASAICFDAGVTYQNLETAWSCFAGVKRRMEFRGQFDNIDYYDDFAHHPTAIAKTLNALRVHHKRQIAIVVPTNYTQRELIMVRELIEACRCADQAVLVTKHQERLAGENCDSIEVVSSVEEAMEWWEENKRSGDQCVAMSAKSMDLFFSAQFETASA